MFPRSAIHCCSVLLQFSYDASPTQFKFLRLLSKEGVQDVSHECLDNNFDLTISSFNGQKISSFHPQCKVSWPVFHLQTRLAMAAMLRKQDLFVCLESHWFFFSGYYAGVFRSFSLQRLKTIALFDAYSFRRNPNIPRYMQPFRERLSYNRLIKSLRNTVESYYG